MAVRIAFVCPTYKETELHAYTMACLHSFFQHTKDGLAIVVDDASTGWTQALAKKLADTPMFPGQQCEVLRFKNWGGLTRSWNLGLKKASELKADYAIAGNNDVLFTPRWYEGLMLALEHGYHLAGPVSNAPGITAQGLAEVWRYHPSYEVKDDPNYLKQVAEYLRGEHAGTLIEAKVNGFFQFARMRTWEAGKFDADHYYRPRNDFNSKGKRNPTPLMTLNEDELQGRWHRKGWKSVVVPSSFIFHYRAVTRGKKHTQGRWFRKK